LAASDVVNTYVNNVGRPSQSTSMTLWNYITTIVNIFVLQEYIFATDPKRKASSSLSLVPSSSNCYTPSLLFTLRGRSAWRSAVLSRMLLISLALRKSRSMTATAPNCTPASSKASLLLLWQEWIRTLPTGCRRIFLNDGLDVGKSLRQAKAQTLSDRRS
jgi:hypothetical protein